MYKVYGNESCFEYLKGIIYFRVFIEFVLNNFYYQYILFFVGVVLVGFFISFLFRNEVVLKIGFFL